MKQLLNIFFRAEGTKPWLVLACLLLASLSEALGIGTLRPAANTILGDNANNATGASLFIRTFIESLGISANLGNLLTIVVALLTLKAVIAFGALAYAGISGARVAINLRRKLIKAIFEARWSFYADQNRGRFANTISNDATRAGDAYQFSAVVVAGILQLTAYTAVAIFCRLAHCSPGWRCGGYHNARNEHPYSCFKKGWIQAGRSYLKSHHRNGGYAE